MKRMTICAAAVAALLAGCMGGPTGEAARVAEMAMEQPAPPAMEFLRMAAASDLYEIQSSQLVLQTTQNPQLRAFAQMMIEHHTQTTAALAAAAQAAGMTPPPPALDAPRTQMIRELQAASGTARDQVYMRQQVAAHEEALMLHTRYSNNGDVPELKRASAAAVPIVARHYNEIVAMNGGGGIDHSGH